MKPDFPDTDAGQGRRDFLGVMALASSGLITAAANTVSAKSKINFDDPQQKLDAFIKTEGDTSGAEHVVYGESTIFALIRGQPGRPLIKSELYAVRRYMRTDGGWIRLHREAGVYRDLETDEILSHWYNPYLEREVEVIDLAQEFNRKYLASELGKTLDIGVMVHGDDVFFQRNFFISRKSSITPDEYPLHSSGPNYDLAEYHNYFTKLSAIEDENLSAAPAFGVTNSVNNWLPWMEMGNRPGYLIHQSRFKKLKGVNDMPEGFVAHIAAHYPDHLLAPTEFREIDLNTTGWNFYKQVIDERCKNRS